MAIELTHVHIILHHVRVVIDVPTVVDTKYGRSNNATKTIGIYSTASQ